MLKVETHPAWRDAACELVSRVRSGEQLAVLNAGVRERLVAGVLDVDAGAVHVYVPRSADQTERVLVSMAEQLGTEAVEAVNHHLQQGLASAEPLLEALTPHLADRPLVVDGWDRLGDHGPDPELSLALKERALEVRRWLGEFSGLFLSRRVAPEGAQGHALPETPPVQLVNGESLDTADVWKQAEGDPRRYALALACKALGVEVEDDFTDRSLRVAIGEALPPGVVQVLARVALHGRPLPRHIATAGLGDASLDDGCDLGLWAVSGDTVLADPRWSAFLWQRDEKEVRVRSHQALAKLFLDRFREGDPTAARSPLVALEAYRHLVAAGDVDRARPFVRFGAALLVDAARRESIAGRYERAAMMYGAVVGAIDHDGLQLPPRLRAYARHYLHFNRGHAFLEPLAATERGFRHSLQDWRGNALFWSRLIRTVCYQGRRPQALSDLTAAQRAVEEHPQKQTVLRARTVRGLLDRDRRLDAVEIWSDYEADTPYARDIERRLVGAVSAGWTVRALDPVGVEPVVFVRPVELRIARAGSRWSAELVGLDLFGRGATPREAARALAARTRNEASRLVQAYTSDLSGNDRLKKRRLLGVIDVLASGVGGKKLDAYWVMGTFERDAAGRLWLASSGTDGRRYAVPDDLDVTVDELVHLARVATNDRGVPEGPVLQVEPGFTGTEEALWEAWRALIADAG